MIGRDEKDNVTIEYPRRNVFLEFISDRCVLFTRQNSNLSSYRNSTIFILSIIVNMILLTNLLLLLIISIMTKINNVFLQKGMKNKRFDLKFINQ